LQQPTVSPIATADDTRLTVKVRRYPPGTSKCNKSERRLFCHITQNWRARPLLSRLAVVELIAATTTKAGATASPPPPGTWGDGG
jgi:hypothetical protein